MSWGAYINQVTYCAQNPYRGAKPEQSPPFSRISNFVILSLAKARLNQNFGSLFANARRLAVWGESQFQRQARGR